MHSNHTITTPTFTKTNTIAMGKPKGTYKRLISKLGGTLKSALRTKGKLARAPEPLTVEAQAVSTFGDATSPGDDEYVPAPYKITDFFPPQQYPYMGYRPMITDEYYGREYVAKMSARFILSQFEFAGESSMAFRSMGVSLPHFIAYALRYINLPDSINMCALNLLWRLKLRIPKFRVENYHVLYLTALMVAAKMFWESYYSISCWSTAGQGLFAPHEMIVMERELCKNLEWSFNVCLEDLEVLEDAIQATYGADPIQVVPATWAPIFVAKHSNPHSSAASTCSSSSSSEYPLCQIPPEGESDDSVESRPYASPSASSYSTSSSSSSGSPKCQIPWGWTGSEC